MMLLGRVGTYKHGEEHRSEIHPLHLLTSPPSCYCHFCKEVNVHVASTLEIDLLFPPSILFFHPSSSSLPCSSFPLPPTSLFLPSSLFPFPSSHFLLPSPVPFPSSPTPSSFLLPPSSFPPVPLPPSLLPSLPQLGRDNPKCEAYSVC